MCQCMLFQANMQKKKNVLEAETVFFAGVHQKMKGRCNHHNKTDILTITMNLLNV